MIQVGQNWIANDTICFGIVLILASGNNVLFTAQQRVVNLLSYLSKICSVEILSRMYSVSLKSMCIHKLLYDTFWDSCYMISSTSGLTAY